MTQTKVEITWKDRIRKENEARLAGSNLLRGVGQFRWRLCWYICKLIHPILCWDVLYWFGSLAVQFKLELEDANMDGHGFPVMSTNEDCLWACCRSPCLWCIRVQSFTVFHTGLGASPLGRLGFGLPFVTCFFTLRSVFTVSNSIPQDSWWYILIYMYISGWFGTFFIFPYIGNNNPNWLSYFSEG